MRRSGIGIVCLCGLLVHATTVDVHAKESLEAIEAYNSLADPIATPHTKWAKPYARGTVRALFIHGRAPGVNVLPLRPIVEVMQRFDIEGKAILVAPVKEQNFIEVEPGKSGVHGGEIGEQRLARLLDDTYDCYVVLGEIMGYIPEKSRMAMLKKVKSGAGLFSFGDLDQRLLAGAKPIKQQPSLLSGLAVDVLTLGKGRVVIFKHRSLGINAGVPSREQAIFGFHFWRGPNYERHGRAMLWAAKREPNLELSISMPSDGIARAELSKQVIRVNCKGKGGTLRVKTRFRDPANTATRSFEGFESRSASEAVWIFQIPSLPAGMHQFDVIAESDQGVEAWATRQFTVTADEQVADVTLDREWGVPGKSIEGTVTVKTNSSDSRTLRVTAIDRYARAVAQEDFSNPGEKVTFSLPTSPQMPNYMVVKATLMADDEPVVSAYSPPYTIPVSKQDRWAFIVWGRLFANDILDLADDLMAASGATSRLETTAVPWWYMSRAGMNYVPYCVSGLWRPPDTGRNYPVVGPDGLPGRGAGCWNDEPAVSKRVEKYIGDEMDFRRHGVLVYSMGDEQTTRGGCLHPACWERYQEYLREQYGGDISALNDSWGTSHNSFEQIEPFVDTTAIPWIEMPRRLGWQKSFANVEKSSIGPTNGSTAWNESMKSYPRWYDRGAFHYWNFAKYVKRFTDQARQMDPEAKAGVEGTSNDLDQDIYTIVQDADFWMPYQWQEPTNEVIRSITPQGYRHGNFIGMTNFWFCFLRGSNTVAKFRAPSFLSPQMGLAPGMDRVVDSARIVFDGLGTLLNVNTKTQMLHDGVVMLHSYPSFQAMKLEEGPSYGRSKDRSEDTGYRADGETRNRRSHKAWHRTIRACGLQFNYVSDRQILRDEFDPSPYKLMILSQCESISPKEATFIHEFVARGGTVIADVRPGIYGARCKPRQNGVLDDLFGVRHTGNVEAVASPGRIVGTIGDRDVAVEVLNMRVNPAVEVTTGTALGRAGRTPLCIINKVGKGQAVLLNFTSWSYPNIAEHAGPDDAISLIRALFTDAGLRRPLTLLDANGRPHRNLEAVRWRTGKGVDVVALHGPDRDTWPDVSPAVAPPPFDGLDTPIPVTVRLPGSRHVYEIRTGRSYGRTDEFTTGLRPWWATFLVLSDRELSPPVLAAARETVTRGETLKIEARVSSGEAVHALRIRIMDPDGNEAPWFSRSLLVEDGRKQFDVPIAHNEQTGTWTITATDLYTEESATVSILVQ